MHAPHVSPMPARPWRSGAGFGPAHLCARVLARDHSEDRGVYPFVSDHKSGGRCRLRSQVAQQEPQRGPTAATKLGESDDCIDCAVSAVWVMLGLTQFDNLAQETRFSKLVVQGISARLT
jgi:hypothetical protein